MRWYLIVALIWVSLKLMNLRTYHAFVVQFLPLRSIYSYPLPGLKLDSFLCYWVLKVLYIKGLLSFVRLIVSKSFPSLWVVFPFCWLFPLLYRNFLVWDNPSFCFCFYFLCFWSLIQKIAAYTNVMNCFPLYFITFVLNWGLLSISSLFFVIGWDRGVKFQYSACEYPVFPTFIELSFLNICFWQLGQESSVNPWGYFWMLSILFHLSVYTFLSQYHVFGLL